MTEQETTPPAAEETSIEAPAPAPEPEVIAPVAEARPAPRPVGTPPDGNWWWGTGRRKASVARVRVRPGDGKFLVNEREYDEYFTEDRDRKDLQFVLETTSTNGRIDVHVKVHGGGYTGQAGAIILGLGRAILAYDQTLEPILRDHDFLSRDPRKVERKKYGQPGARARFQFSKR